MAVQLVATRGSKSSHSMSGKGGGWQVIGEVFDVWKRVAMNVQRVDTYGGGGHGDNGGRGQVYDVTFRVLIV